MKKTLGIIISGLALIAGLVLVAPAQAATDVLPDLRSPALTDFRIENASNGQKRLRFSTRIANAGPGKFEIRMYRPDTTTAQMKVEQRIFNTSGVYRRVQAPGTKGFYNAGDGHDHWHVFKLQEFSIHRINADGSEGPSVGSGAKTGFCFLDVVTYNLSLPNAPQTKQYTGCGTRSSLNVKAGISVGWADKYSAGLANQWIKINGLPDGKYRVRVKTDPQNWFAETSNTNNDTSANIRISGSTVTKLA